jgi:SM-20-related protein
MVNLSKPADPNFTHCHPKQVVCLYYANLNWHPNFAGETLFYTEDQKEIRYGSTYTPNRLVIFDGEIPHTIRAQNITGPNYRFSISIFFNK